MGKRFLSLDSLKIYLNELGYKDLKDIDKRSIRVLTNENRMIVFDRLINQLGGKSNPSKSFGGSLGHIDVEEYRIAVKPLSRQGSGSAGVDNEIIIVKFINDTIKEFGTIDVILTDGKIQYKCEKVKSSIQVGADTAGRKKADILINSENKSHSISIKKDNAEYWESADAFWKDKSEYYVTKLLKEKKIKLEPAPGNVVKITPNVGIEATDEETRSVVFGSDILGKGCVVTRTFKPSDFVYDGKTNSLIIQTSNIITKMSEIPESKKVWFLIRNDSTRKSIKLYPGIRTLASYKKRINQNVLKISKSNR